MRPSKRPQHVSGDCSKFETDRWVVTLSRLLSPEEMHKIGEMINTHAEAYDRSGQEFSLPYTIWCVQQIAPEVQVRAWHAEPINVYIHPLYLAPKVYEVQNAMTFKEAAEEAKKKWHQEYPLGVQAAIWNVRLATPYDLRKMQEIKEKQEVEKAEEDASV